MAKSRPQPARKLAKSFPSADAFPFASARAALWDWFKANGRDLPWRVDPTPYRVWVSEIMLQQTTTQTVERYFDRFLERFPDLSAVASAEEEELLKYWEGLGYYRRAKSLRAAAIQLVQARLDDLPDDYDALVRLPGVGRYVAGAVLSFGFDRRAPILEANTTRLHARLLALLESTETASAQAALWNFALDWLPEDYPAPGTYRALNSALMDLGRTVCAPKSPACLACPLRDSCRAAAANLQNVLPVKKERTAPIPRRDVAFWITRADLTLNGAPSVEKSVETQNADLASPDDVLLVKRAKGALWSGLWDFPRFEDVDAASPASLTAALRAFLSEYVQAYPAPHAPGETVATFKHSVTKYRVTLELKRLASAPAGFASPTPASAPTKTNFEAIRWVPLDELKNYPLSSTGRKIAEFVASRS